MSNSDDKNDDKKQPPKFDSDNEKSDQRNPFTTPPPFPPPSGIRDNKADDKKSSPFGGGGRFGASKSPSGGSVFSRRSSYTNDDYEYYDDDDYYEEDDDDDDATPAQTWRDQLGAKKSAPSSKSTDWRSRLSGSGRLPLPQKVEDRTDYLWVAERVWASFYMPDLPDVKDKDVASIQKIFTQAESNTKLEEQITTHLDTYWQQEVNLVGAALMMRFNEENKDQLKVPEDATSPAYLIGVIDTDSDSTLLVCQDYLLTVNILARSTDYVLLADATVMLDEDRLNRWLITNDSRLIELVRQFQYKEVIL